MSRPTAPAETSPPAAGAARAAEADREFVLHDVPWEAYAAFRDALDAQGGRVHMTFLEGTLELVSPSHVHEQLKKVLARLLETYAEERGIDLWAFGSTTFRQEAARGGLEPDECYTFEGGDAEPARPDLALEVAVSRPLTSKLEVYRRLGVPEVWVWRDRALETHRLGDEGYTLSERSGLLPDLDPRVLARFVRTDQSLTQVARAFREALRAR